MNLKRGKILWIVYITVVAVIIVVIYFLWQHIWLITTGWVSTTVLMTIILYFIMNPDAVEKWASIIFRFLSFLGPSFDKRAIASYLQSTINSFSKRINSEVQGILPYGIKIKWVTETTKEAFIKNGEVIVLLRRSNNEARNLATATFTYMSNALIPEARPFVYQPVMVSADLVMARRILLEEHRPDALVILKKEFLEPIASQILGVSKYYDSLEKLDSQGMLTRLIFTEFNELAGLLGLRPPTDTIIKETKDFADVMIRLAEKKPGVDINPDYSGNYIKTSVMLIARTGIDEKTPYLAWVIRCLNKGIEKIHVFARGKDNIALAISVVDKLERKAMIKKTAESLFEVLYGKKVPAIWMLLRPKEH
ncbi:MAG: hypothetical protein QXU95_03405 [Candidatus Bathyarchaeia archaeon]|nr:hypothetical protein [Candidatus Bathyarchaeota archaeon]